MTHDNVTDIERRLRRKTINSAKGDSWSVRLRNPDGPEAAKVIEAQQADLATLRKQLENAREALQDIARPRHGHQALAEDGKEQPKHLYPYYAGVVSQLQHKAREALKGPQ